MMKDKNQMLMNLGIKEGINIKALKSTKIRENNKLKQPNIFSYRGKYAVEFTIGGKHTRTIFSTLEEAIEFRDQEKKKILENF